MRRVTNPETGKFRTFEMTEAEYHELTNDHLGLCVACGETRDCCEPDARRYRCDGGCEAMTVYGAEELMVMGRVAIVEGAAP